MKIVRFFGVPEDYFVDDDVTVAVMRQIQDLIDRRDGTPDADDPGENVELRRLALRILGLSTDERELVSNMVDKLRAYESTPRHRRSRRKPSPVDQG